MSIRRESDIAFDIMSRDPIDQPTVVRDIREAMDVFVPKPALGKPFRNRVRPGVYELHYSFDISNPPLPQSLEESDEIYVMRSDASTKLKNEIKEFWAMRHKFEDMGLLHRRGIILYGKPGSGKTSLIRQESKSMVVDDGVVFISHSPYSLSESLMKFRAVEPDRPVTVVIEDIDELTKSWGEHSILEMIDGMSAANHVLFIATTNNLECLSDKMRRPGRFDRKIEVPYPTVEQRSQYIEKKFSGKMSRQDIRKAVMLTEGLGFGQLRELTVAVSGYGRKLEEAIQEMKSDMLVEQKRLGDRPAMDAAKGYGFF